MDAAASEQQHCLLLNSPAFPVLLRHSSISSKQQIVCSLLACSKAVADVVTQHCVGLVPLHFKVTNWRGSLSAMVYFVEWLSMHTMLARSLHIRLPVPASSPIFHIDEADRKVAAYVYTALGKLLQQAVDAATQADTSSRILGLLQPGNGATTSSSNPLQIQSYRASGITHEILGLLPVNRLTSLEWDELLPTYRMPVQWIKRISTRRPTANSPGESHQSLQPQHLRCHLSNQRWTRYTTSPCFFATFDRAQAAKAAPLCSTPTFEHSSSLTTATIFLLHA